MEIKAAEMQPFVRYARVLEIPSGAPTKEVIALDSRLFYAARGEGAVEIGGVAYKMERGALLIWRAGMPYRLSAAGGAFLRFLAFNFDFTRAAAHVTAPVEPVERALFHDDMVLERVSFSDSPALENPIYIKTAHAHEGALRGIIEEYEKRESFSEGLMSAALTGVILSCLREKAEHRTAPDAGARKAAEILEFLKENYMRGITNAGVGAEFGLHPNYCNSLVARHTGLGIRQNLINIRMEKAAQLLVTTGQSIGEIALQTGFDDPAHFSKSFRRRYGTSPAEFRKQNQTSAL